MLIPAPSDAASMRPTAVAAMAAYLSVSDVTETPNQIRAELIELLDQGEIDLKLAKLALESVDPEVIAYLVARGVPLEKVGPRLRDTHHALSLISMKFLAPTRRRELFRIISGVIPSPSGVAERLLARAAIESRDIELFDAICAWARHTTPTGLVFPKRADFIDDPLPDAAPFWAELLTRIDRTDPAIGDFAETALQFGHLRRIALLLAIRVDLSSAAAALRDYPAQDKSAWLIQLHARASSAHGRLELYARSPALEEVLSMETPALQARLVGLSNRQRRAIKRKQRAKKMPRSLRLLHEASGEEI